MSDAVDFAKRIHQLLSAGREPHWTPEEAEQYKTFVGVRRQRFEHLASHLLDTIIRPRLEILGSHFPIADLIENEPPHHCACWIGYTERFPATTKIAFAFEHDVSHEKVTIRYDARMLPTFVKVKEHDELTFALDEVDDATVADWVENRLLEFLHAYLRIDAGGEKLVDESAIGPRESNAH